MDDEKAISCSRQKNREIERFKALRNDNNSKLLAEYTLLNTPFYNAAALVRTLHENRKIRRIPSQKVEFQYNKNSDNTEIYILIIGESVRRG